MNLRQIRAFITVAEELSFRRAARRLGVSQPPLGRQIHQLEQELELQLFVRYPQGVDLTSHGRLLLEEARQLVTETTHFLDRASGTVTKPESTLRIGLSYGLWDAFNGIRGRCVSAASDLTISVQDMRDEAQAEALRRNQIDVGFLRPPIDVSQLTWEPILDEEVVVMLRDDHPLAHRKSVRLSDLRDQPLIMHDRQLAPAVYDRALELYAAAGLKPKIVRTAAAPVSPGGLMLVASGKGIYLAMGSIRRFQNAGGVAVLDLDEPGASIPIWLAWRQNEASARVLRFIDAVRRTSKPKRRVNRLSSRSPTPARLSRCDQVPRPRA
jgi:DNA-binding transcriptional LysR family regulator